MTEAITADRTWLIETLEALVDEDVADLDPQADLSDYGLDSIRVFELVQKIRAVRSDVQFADIAENLTVDGLCEVVTGGA